MNNSSDDEKEPPEGSEEDLGFALPGYPESQPDAQSGPYGEQPQQGLHGQASNYPPGQHTPGSYPPGQYPPGHYPPGYPGAPGYQHPHQYQYHQMGYVPAPHGAGLSFGAQLGIGTAIGVVIAGITIILMFVSAFEFGASLTLGAGIISIGSGIIALFFEKTRGYATGALIILFSVWLVFIGPCLSLVNL